LPTRNGREFSKGDTSKNFRTLLKHRNQLSFDDVVEAMDVWFDALNGVSKISIGDAFALSVEAYDEFNKQGRITTKNERYIVNGVCLSIGNFACSAYQSFVSYSGAVLMNKDQAYVRPVMDALMTLAPHSSDPVTNDVLEQILEGFKRIISSVYVHPLARYQYVEELFEWLENRLHCDDLRWEMDVLLQEAIFLPDGRGMIFYDLEIQADEWEREDKEWRQATLDIRAAFAVRAGLPVQYSRIYHRIEDAFKVADFKQVENHLYSLFYRLAEHIDKEADSIPNKDIPVYSYLLSRADKLSKLSPINGFQLAERCIETIEAEGLLNQHLLSTVYGFALPIISDAENFEGYTGRIKELYKTIMKRSSEFEMSECADQIFDNACVRFENYLAGISPVSRYLEVSELARWVDSRERAEGPLADFVNPLLSSSVSYGNGMGIPFASDVGAIVSSLPAPRIN